MPLTGERKILMAVAGLAGLLVLGDQLLLGGGGPSQAQAQAQAAPPIPAAPASPAPIAPAPTSTPAADTPSLAQRLDRLDGSLGPGAHDAFRPSSYWQTPHGPAPTSPGPAFDANAFAQRHTLEAVFNAGDASRAVVNGRAVHPGEQREGMTLTRIGPRWVIWAGHGVRIKVHLDPKS